jgi:hypothetical protein
MYIYTFDHDLLPIYDGDRLNAIAKEVFSVKTVEAGAIYLGCPVYLHMYAKKSLFGGKLK